MKLNFGTKPEIYVSFIKSSLGNMKSDTQHTKNKQINKGERMLASPWSMDKRKSLTIVLKLNH